MAEVGVLMCLIGLWMAKGVTNLRRSQQLWFQKAVRAEVHKVGYEPRPLTKRPCVTLFQIRFSRRFDLQLPGLKLHLLTIVMHGLVACVLVILNG